MDAAPHQRGRPSAAGHINANGSGQSRPRSRGSLHRNNLRRNYTNEIDISLDKNFKFTERRYVQIRFEAFNIANHVTFGAVNTTPTNSAFGTIGSQANTPRRLETAIRLVW